MLASLVATAALDDKQESGAVLFPLPEEFGSTGSSSDGKGDSAALNKSWVSPDGKVIASSTYVRNASNYDPQAPAGYDVFNMSVGVPVTDLAQTIVVTPVMLRDRMELLHWHLMLHQQEGAFEQWHLWDNTPTPEDESWLRGVNQTHAWVRLVEFPDEACARTRSLKGTKKGVTCFWRDPIVQTVLFTHTIIRLDDDMVWLDTPDALRGWAEFTRSHHEYMATFANVVNNGMSTYFQQNMCSHLKELPEQPRSAKSYNGSGALALHKYVLAMNRPPNSLRCDTTVETHAEHFALNAVAWHGPRLAALRPGILPHNLSSDEDIDFSVWIPLGKRLPTAWYGNFVAVKFATEEQQDKMSEAYDIFQAYEQLAPDLSGVADQQSSSGGYVSFGGSRGFSGTGDEARASDAEAGISAVPKRIYGGNKEEDMKETDMP